MDSTRAPNTTRCCGSGVYRATIDGVTWFECAECGRILS